MIVNFKFLGSEPIENVITCMNFKVDEVVFFGYREVIEAQQKNVKDFLQRYCEVSEVVFCPVSRDDLQAVLGSMRREMEQETARGSRIFFDVTGGEGLTLIAFGMLAREFSFSIYRFDVKKDELAELETGRFGSICEAAKVRKVRLNLDMLVELHGGKINYTLHKENKNLQDASFRRDVEAIWHVMKEEGEYWNPFADFLRNVMVPVENLQVCVEAEKVRTALRTSKKKLCTEGKLQEILSKLEAGGVLLDVRYTGENYEFAFKEERIKDCLWEGGSVLELHICQTELESSDDCLSAVHLDWDGVIHEQPGVDVVNEIDVLSLRGNIPTFISCKSGKLGGQQILHALYELETVAGRFGGKYARKVLISMKKLGSVYEERAAEMGIELKEG